MADYIDHMPVAVQRQAKAAWSAISSPEDDAAYKGAFDQIHSQDEHMVTLRPAETAKETR